MSRIVCSLLMLGWWVLFPSVARSFDFTDVVAKARILAEKPYRPPKPIPVFLQNLGYSKYQQIRFKPAKSLWRADHSRFQVMLISPGLYYKNKVRINIISPTGVHPLRYAKSDFTFPSRKFAEKVPADLGFAGFKLTYPFTTPNVQNQFLVFAGASYFRGVGKDNAFGLSARGMAIDTALPQGEQFPSFVEYWLQKPKPQANKMQFYALLNGKSLTGAYRFTVFPGAVTRLQVQLVLFLRRQVQLLGIAPLTSMFFYGENTPRPALHWRPQVHDSGGLLIHNRATGEWLWRPLINPRQVHVDYFAANGISGFGLLQRQTRFCQYQDAGARYDKRPSAWITPQGDWGEGNVVLVELPETSEVEDNIVAFWSPRDKPVPGKPLKYAYTLNFGGSDMTGESIGQATQTFVGGGNVTGSGSVKGAYRVIVDFKGGPLAHLPAGAPVTGVVTALQGGKVVQHAVEYVEPLHQWRLSILAKPAAGKPLELRAFLRAKKRTLTETWTYHLPWDNKIRGQSR